MSYEINTNMKPYSEYEPDREPDRSVLQQASEGIADRLHNLQCVVERLEMRLRPVLHDEHNAIAVGESALASLPALVSEHTAHLQKHQRFISDITSGLERLIDRLDV